MKKLPTAIAVVLYGVLFGVVANSYCLLKNIPDALRVLIPLFVLANLFAGFFLIRSKSFRLHVCLHGAILLLAFQLSTLLCVAHHIWIAFSLIPGQFMTFLWSALFCICAEAVVFWNGIACLYLSSVQMGIKQRLIGALCGMIPLVNLIVLNRMIHTVLEEVTFEQEKELCNARRKSQQLCKTRYPILMVHGVFFRDTKYFNYWGRIPRELEQNGATIYYGNHQSAASVANSAEELIRRIEQIVSETGCEKVNIIAHSKGGLDCRYAIAKLGAAPYVASLTTVNTPHRGCLFADHLLTVIPEETKDKVATAYNTALRKLGDENPDFIAAVSDLTASSCARFNEKVGTPEGIFCQSVGSVMPRASGGKFPMNFSYQLVKYFDGINDGLVSETSFQWGEKYTLLTPSTGQGISHGDMIDLNRQNLDGFDVREFYVQLVNDLKNRGY